VLDLELRRKEEDESTKVLKEISIIDRGGGRRTIDLVLVERAKVSKRIRVVDLERTRGRRSITPGKFTSKICVCGDVRTPEG
jgi:hypothetical protein